MNSTQLQATVTQEVQADIPEQKEDEEQLLKIRGLDRIKLYPKVPVEPSPYGKYSNFSRAWILQDGREPPEKGSMMKSSYKVPRKPKHLEGIRKRMMTDFFWEQMLQEMMDEIKTSDPVKEYCTEYNAQFIKENFVPRNLEESKDPLVHLKYPLYGAGTSPTTFYSSTIQKKSKDILEKFRKTQDFTKPMEERLDNGWVL